MSSFSILALGGDVSPHPPLDLVFFNMGQPQPIFGLLLQTQLQQTYWQSIVHRYAQLIVNMPLLTRPVFTSWINSTTGGNPGRFSPLSLGYLHGWVVTMAPTPVDVQLMFLLKACYSCPNWFFLGISCTARACPLTSCQLRYVNQCQQHQEFQNSLQSKNCHGPMCLTSIFKWKQMLTEIATEQR